MLKDNTLYQQFATALDALVMQRANPPQANVVTGPSFVNDPVVYWGRCRAKAGNHQCLRQSEHSGKHLAGIPRWPGSEPMRSADPLKWERTEVVLVEFPVLSVGYRSGKWSSPSTPRLTSTGTT